MRKTRRPARRPRRCSGLRLASEPACWSKLTNILMRADPAADESSKAATSVQETCVPRNLTIGQKLTISFGVVLALTGVLSYSSLGTIRRLGGTIDLAVNENART